MSNIVWGFPAPGQTVLADSTPSTGPLVYKAQVINDGLGGPTTEIVLENTLGLTNNWTYLIAGVYQLSESTLDPNKVIINATNNTATTVLSVTCGYNGVYFTLATYDNTGYIESNGVTSVTIEYYP